MKSVAVSPKQEGPLIQTIIFDLGGVLLRWDPLSYLFEHIGAPYLTRWFMETIFLSSTWTDLDRGILSFEQGREFFRNQISPHEGIFDTLWEGLPEILVPLAENISVLEDFYRNQYDLLFLSNFIEAFDVHVRFRYSFFELFRGGVMSYQVRSVKPESLIYEVLIKDYSLIPEKCLFIDDRHENVEKARSMGMHALFYGGGDNLRKELLRILL